MINRLRLRTLPAQLIALFVAVLLVSQVVNVFLIIGERRLQARSILYAAAIEKMAQRTEHILSGTPVRHDPERIGATPPLRLEVGSVPLFTRLIASECLPSYEAQLGDFLQARNIVVETVQVCRGSALRPPDFQRRLVPPPDAILRGERQRPPGPPPPHLGPPPDPRGPPGPGFESMVMSVQLSDGRWVNGVTGHYPLENMTPRVFLATGGLVLLTILMVVFFARRVTRPLTNLTNAADRLGRGGQGITLKEEGPSDLRAAIAAFNSMQERLTRMIETQRTMLRSVGHDLRTPLTSLRIRAEAMEPEGERAKVIITLDEMKVMIEEILTWAEDASGMEELHRVDVNALLTSLTDDYRDAGHAVTYAEGEAVVTLCRRVSLRRALRNLIDNGLKYGGEVTLSLDLDGEAVRICVDDNGPGIPEPDLQEVLKPFVRLEVSRNKATGGAGLGLSIARSIIQAHGAELVLENRKGGGLRASFRLPRDA